MDSSVVGRKADRRGECSNEYQMRYLIVCWVGSTTVVDVRRSPPLNLVRNKCRGIVVEVEDALHITMSANCIFPTTMWDEEGGVLRVL